MSGPSSSAFQRGAPWGMDSRLRAAVDSSICWYDEICASHGIAASIVDGLWVSHGPPPPLHSAASVVEPSVEVRQVLRAIQPFDRCSVADCFSSLDLGGVGMEVLFTAEWIHAPAPHTTGEAAGWELVADAAELAEWNGHHDTVGVLLPSLLERARFRIMVKYDGNAIVGGAVAHLCTGVVSVSNVFAVPPAAVDWAELVGAVSTWFPGRAMVGYERCADLSGALAAGFTTVGQHRVWAR